MSTQLENHRPQFKLVHQLGDDIIAKSVAKDTSYVNTVLNNVDINWKALKDLLELR